jgi:hypothetical protein
MIYSIWREGDVSFDFEAYQGALWSLSEALHEVEKKTGFSVEALSGAFLKRAIARRDMHEVGLWKNACSEHSLGKWLFNRSKRKFDRSDEVECLKLAREIPYRVRAGLIDVSKQLPRPPGGKRRALQFLDAWEARTLVRTLLDEGITRGKAYAKAAKKFRVSVHTIRRECEPQERQRRSKVLGEGIDYTMR